MRQRVRCRQKAGGKQRSKRAWGWEPMTVHQARKLERGDPVSVADSATGLRKIGVVIATPRIGPGHKTLVQIAVGWNLETCTSVGSKMDRLLRPDRAVVLEYIPPRCRKPRHYVLYRGNHLDF